MTQSTAAAPEPDEEAKAVADYLRAHPSFFVENPGLLPDLEIPHATGGAVSLVERQLMALRDQNKQLRARFRDLITIARENEELSRRMHELTLALLRAADPAAFFRTLREGLVRDCNADRVAVQIYAVPKDGCALEEFRGREAPERALFESVLAARRPVCGRVKKQQLAVVFGEAADALGSAVLVPLAGTGWDGVIVVASADARRYHPDMGIELLTHLCEVASLRIDAWAAA